MIVLIAFKLLCFGLPAQCCAWSKPASADPIEAVRSASNNYQSFAGVACISRSVLNFVVGTAYIGFEKAPVGSKCIGRLAVHLHFHYFICFAIEFAVNILIR